MATFTTFTDILPDPDNKISIAGSADASGDAGPGFASVKFRSNNQVQKARTISGRGTSASPASHYWEFDINYNPITRDEFEPVSSFLELRQGGLKPFFVILPQYNRPRDDTFNTYLATNTVSVKGAHSAGSATLLIDGAAAAISGDPKVGDFFTITDGSDVNHTKVYKVARVETPSLYQTGLAVNSGERRLHIMPPLTRDTADNSVVNFINPKFRVRQKNETLEYDLDVDGLFQFSLSLEEILP